MEQTYNSIKLIQLIFKWKFHFLIVIILAVVLSIVFSGPYFIKPKYKSYTIIYPSNLIPYSSETPTEQMLQLFRSDEIRDGIIKKFNLIQHYHIDTTKPYYYTTVMNEYEDNVTIEKTRYESVLIEVMDVDPVIARDIISEMIDLFNKKVRDMQRAKTREVIKIWQKLLVEKEQQIDSLEKRQDEIRKNYNILDYVMQTKEATRGYVSGGGSSKAGEILTNLRDYGGEYGLLQENLEKSTDAYNDIKLEYEKSMSDLTKELTYTNIVSEPIPADKKSYPVRWLIVLLSGLSSLFLTLLVIIIIEKYREFRPKLKNS